MRKTTQLTISSLIIAGMIFPTATSYATEGDNEELDHLQEETSVEKLESGEEELQIESIIDDPVVYETIREQLIFDRVITSDYEGEIDQTMLNKISYLRFESNSATNVDFSDLLKLPSLERLYIGDGFAENDIHVVGELTQLVSLRLDGIAINDPSFISSLTNLQSLSISNAGLTTITFLEPLTNLEELRLDSNQISNIIPLNNLVNLSKLSLYENQVADISPLTELNKLEEVSLSYNQILDNTPLMYNDIRVLSMLDQFITLEPREVTIGTTEFVEPPLTHAGGANGVGVSGEHIESFHTPGNYSFKVVNLDPSITEIEMQFSGASFHDGTIIMPLKWIEAEEEIEDIEENDENDENNDIPENGEAPNNEDDQTTPTQPSDEEDLNESPELDGVLEETEEESIKTTLENVHSPTPIEETEKATEKNELKELPQTGDRYPIWMSLIGTSLIGLSAIVFFFKGNKRKKLNV